MNLIKLSRVTNVATGITVASLPMEQQIALAVCSQISAAGNNKAATGQASAMVVAMAIQAQRTGAEAFAADVDVDLIATRNAQWAMDKKAVFDALHNAAVAEYAANLALHLHAGTAKVGKEKLTGMNALLQKAKTTFGNYCSRIEAGWLAGITLNCDTDTKGNDLPESLSSFGKRTTEAQELADTRRSAGRITSKKAQEFADAVRAALLGDEKSPQIANPLLCATLDKLLPSITLLILKAQASDDVALSTLVEATAQIGEFIEETYPAPEQATEGNTASDAASTLPEGEEIEQSDERGIAQAA